MTSILNRVGGSGASASVANGKRQRGQSLVEFALVLPLLVLILMGILDFGRAFYAYSVVANSAREGARVGVVAPTTDAEIRAAVRRFTIGLEAIPDAKIAITPSGTRVSGETIRVRVEYDFLAVTPLIDSFLPGGRLTLFSSATMVVE